jgi:hypothetical protein
MTDEQGAGGLSAAELGQLLLEVRAVVTAAERRGPDRDRVAAREELLRRLTHDPPQAAAADPHAPSWDLASKHPAAADAKKRLADWIGRQGFALGGAPGVLRGHGWTAETRAEATAVPVVSVEDVAATPEWRAHLAALAATEVVRAEADRAARALEVDALIAPGARGTESDAVVIAKINASVERERIAAEHVLALRKIESDEKIASLRGAVEQLVAAMKAATDREVAVEARIAELQRQRHADAGELERLRLANANTLAVESKRGFGALAVAVVGLVGVIGGAVIGACTKSSSTGGSPQSPGLSVATGTRQAAKSPAVESAPASAAPPPVGTATMPSSRP